MRQTIRATFVTVMLAVGTCGCTGVLGEPAPRMDASPEADGGAPGARDSGVSASVDAGGLDDAASASSDDAAIDASTPIVGDRLLVYLLPHGFAPGQALPAAPGALPPVLRSLEGSEAPISGVWGLTLPGLATRYGDLHLHNLIQLLTGVVPDGDFDVIEVRGPSLDEVVRLGTGLPALRLDVEGYRRARSGSLSWVSSRAPAELETNLLETALELDLDYAPYEDVPPNARTTEELFTRADASLRLIRTAMTAERVRVGVVLTCDDYCGVHSTLTDPLFGNPVRWWDVFHEQDVSSSEAALRAITALHEGLIAVLRRTIDELAAERLADGRTALEHTLILVVDPVGVGESGLATPVQHERRNLVAYLVGGGAGHRGGMWLNAGEAPYERLLLTVARAFGATEHTFGADAPLFPELFPVR